jgi:hypothetical protein
MACQKIIDYMLLAMKKLFTTSLVLLFCALGFCQNPIYLVGQNYFNPGTWAPTGTQGAMGPTGFGSVYQLITTGTATGVQYFRFNSASATSGSWYGPTASSVTVASNTATTTSAGNTSFAYGLNIISTTDNIVFNAGPGAPGAAKFVAFAIAGSVRTINTVAQAPIASAVNPGQAVAVTATLSGSLAAGQSVYLRYTKDAWATSTVMQMTGAASTYTASIPGATNTASATINYYTFTSNGVVGSASGPMANGNDADLFTINANNNGGATYSYTVSATSVWYWVGGTAAALTTTTTTVLSSTLGGAASNVTLGTTDKIIFDGSDISSAAGLQTGNITISNTIGALSFGQLVLQNNANITYSPTSTFDISLNGGTGTDLAIAAGSVFSFGATSNPKLNVLTGATGSILGTVNIGVASSGSQQLVGIDASAITFQSGAVCTVNSAAGTYPFGTGTSGSIVFANGSTLKHTKSEDIFGGSGKTVVLFQTGSVYEYTGINGSYFNFRLGGSPAKTYADVVINPNGTFSTGSYSSNITVDNFTVAATATLTSVFVFDLQDAGHTLTIKGNLINNNVYPLNFAPNVNGTATINFSGTGLQSIINKTGLTGGINFGTTTTSRPTLVNVTAGATVRLGNGVDLGNFTLTSPASVPANTVFTVKNGGTLDMLTSVVYGLAANNGGTFTTESNSIVKTGHLGGLSTTATTGAVQTQLKNYNSGGNYVFNGTTGAQATGNFVPSTSPTANTINNLTIDNTAGVTFNVASGTVNVNGVLNLTNGIFNTITNNAKVTVPSGASVTRTNGWVYGSLQKYVSGSTNFEVGDNLYYTNVNVAGAITTPGLFTVKTNPNGDHPNIGTSDMDATKSENTYWTLTNNTVTFSSGAALTFNYPTPDIDATAVATNFKLGRYATSVWTYPAPATASANSIAVTGVTTFGDFQAASAGCGAFGTWKGTVSSDWNDAANWCGGVPNSFTDVTIPNTANQPIISLADAIVKTITINSGSVLTMSGTYNLTVAGASFTNNAGAPGFINSSSTGAVIFTGATAAISGTTIFQNVTVTNSGLDFGTSSTLNGTFTINAGGYVNNNHPPVYACTATLLYNNGGAYTRGAEWKSGVVAGQAGFPGNVRLSTAGTNFNFGSAAAAICSSLTIDAGTTFDMGASTNNALTVGSDINANGNFYLSMGIGGDVYLSGDYTVGSSGVVFNNSRATFFNGTSGTQTITKVGGGIVYFDFMIVNKTLGDVRLSNVAGNLTDVQINSSTNNATSYVLQLLGGNIDLNDGTFTLNGTVGNSTNIFTGGTGVRRIYTSTGTGNFNVIGAASAGVQNLNVNRASTASSLTFDANVTLATSVGVDFGPSGMTLINSILQINFNGFCINNSPDYGNSSFLIYNNGGGGFNRNVEWNSNVNGPGYPNNIIVQNNTPLVLDAFTFTAAGLGCTGYLDIKSGSSVTMGTLAKNITVATDLIISGTLSLSTVAGGDLLVGQNWTRTGIFNQNNRNVTFNGSLDGTLTASGGQEFSFVYINKNANANKLTLTDNVSVTDEIGFTQGTLDIGTNNKFITLLSTSAKTARVAPSSAANTAFIYGASDNSGQFIVQRYMPARRAWRLVAAPLKPVSGTHSIAQAWQEQGNGASGRDYTAANWAASVAADTLTPAYGTLITGGAVANGFDVSSNNNTSIKYFSGAGVWSTPANTNITSVNSQEGWLLFVRGDRKNYGEITNQYKTPTITTLRPRGQIFIGQKTISASGMQTVGNPYASAVDYVSMIRTGAGWPGNPTYYVWDPYLGGAEGVGAFVALTWNGTDFSRSVPLTGTGSSTFDNRFIPSGAAIMVDFPAGGGTLQMNETDKNVANTTLAFRPVRQQLMTVLKTVNADQTTYVSDGALSLFDRSFNTDADINDARKLSNVNENIALQRNGNILSIERMKLSGESDTIFYFTNRLQRKNYQLQFEITNLQLPGTTAAFLEDTYLKTKTAVALQGTTEINFSVTADAATTATDRFRLVFRRSIKYTNVNASANGNNVAITWTVSDQLNNDSYEIERSNDGKTFKIIDTKLSSGESSLPVSYTSTDAALAAGEYYYRIKSKSKNGIIAYSDAVKVSIIKESPAMFVFPNPVTNNIIQLRLNKAEAGVYLTTLSASNGQIIHNEKINHAGGTATKNINLKQQIESGNYQLKVSRLDGKVEVIKVLVANEL